MAKIFGVCLLPASGEFVYDPLPAKGAQWNATGGPFGAGALATFTPINCFYAPGGTKTDYSQALDQLQAAHPECQTVALVCAWFGNSTNAANCSIYPSTNFIGGAFESFVNGAWPTANWQVSGLTQGSSGLIAISTSGGAATYGGTPSDQSIVRCIQDLKSRGLRVVFYPFILMDAPGKPWRGNITLASDLVQSTTTAVEAFLGSAAPSQFSRDNVNLTVNYDGSPTDFTFRRFILHYAHLCAVAGGVDLFLIGSELRGLEILRGPAWTPSGTMDANGHALWDYPFVAGLIQLAADVRSVFDGAGLTKNATAYKNLIAYSPDWSVWNGVQHAGQNGQWPHLDQLFASPNIDIVSFDNYLPLSDWTLGGGLDCLHWQSPAPTSWPPSPAAMSNLGLSGAPTIYNAAYLQANIEGGEGFNWFYNDSTSGGVGLDPLGTDQRCTLPLGDRLAQARNAFSPNQQLLARKALRWWWNNTHQAVYDAGDGMGWAPHGPTTQWTPQAKPITFAEYGFASVDRCTNQPNVFYDVKLSDSATPFWSLWQGPYGSVWLPRRDDLLADMALQAVHDYWSSGTKNEISAAGVPMIFTPFCCAWNWDARPFPVFPLEEGVWSDGGDWATGNWIGGKGPALDPPMVDAPPGPGAYVVFPTLVGRGWSIAYAPRFSLRSHAHVSGREVRVASMSAPLYDISLSFDLLRSDATAAEVQEVIGFIGANAGQAQPFLFAPPADVSAYKSAPLGLGDGAATAFVICRDIGGVVERVQALIGAPTVYLNGVALETGAYNVSILPATVVFATAPAPGAVLCIDFTAAHLARFADNGADLEQFMSDFWATKTLKLETVRA